jgi:hypothetical protein
VCARRAQIGDEHSKRSNLAKQMIADKDEQVAISFV